MKNLLTNILLLIFISATLSASPINLTEEEKEFIKKNPNVTIGMLPDFGLFSYIVDGKIDGFEHDLVNIIAEKTGLKFEKRIDSWPVIYKLLQDKKIDMVSAISYKKYREKFTIFTNSYYDIPTMIFIANNFGEYEGLKSLKGKKIGIIKNVFYQKDLTKIDYLDFIFYASYEKLTQDLALGNIDAFVQNLPTINHIINKHAYSNIIIAEELNLPTVSREDLRFGIQSEKTVLASIMQKAIENISPKEYEMLANKWISIHYQEKNNLKLIILIIIIVFILFSSIIYWVFRIKKSNKQLEKLAISDKLTNLYNRRKLEELLQTEINKSERFKTTFLLVLLDIDYFKDVNDTYGHQTGDIVLVEFANILKNTLRKTDFIGRFGGEEFMVICPESNISDIQPLIEDLRIKISNTSFEKVGKKTASFGITSFKKGDTTETIIKRADDALYDAKNNGRNKIKVNF